MGAKYRKQREYHGGTRTRIYNAHYNMLERCNNPKCKDYPHYGGRGVKVAKEFVRFADYRSWFQRAFTLADIPEGLTLDRLDNQGDYEPANMRLATYRQQNNNKRSSKVIEWQGQSKTVAQWAEAMGIDRKTLEKRLGKYGWPIERALTEATDRRIEYNGQKHTLTEWAAITGLGYTTISYRLCNGWPVDEALTKPSRKG